MKTSLRSVITHQPVTKCVQREGKEREEEKGACRYGQRFRLQIPVIYVMFNLTIWVAGTDDRVIINFLFDPEPCGSCFKNQNKKVSIGT